VETRNGSYLKRKTMKNVFMAVLAVLICAAFTPAKDNAGDLSGTWRLDPARSDLGRQPPRSTRTGTGSSGGLGLPGTITLPGIGFPGAVGLPGSGSPSPGIGYPGSRRPTGYPGGGGGTNGGDPGEGMPQENLQNLSLKIVQNDNEVAVTRRFTLNSQERMIAQIFTLDGNENSNPASNGHGEYVSRSSWRDGKLTNSGVQTPDTSEQSYQTTVREEYSVSKDGKTLTIKTATTNYRGEMTLRLVCKKEEN
jgi:hypothetical protein